MLGIPRKTETEMGARKQEVRLCPIEDEPNRRPVERRRAVAGARKDAPSAGLNSAPIARGRWHDRKDGILAYSPARCCGSR